MRILVFGADGFIGSNVCDELEKTHEVTRVVRDAFLDAKTAAADLLVPNDIRAILEKYRPEVVVNCAGVVGGGADVEQNVQFTKNILEQASAIGGVKKVMISGSAGEYGRVDPKNIPVSEGAPLKADSGYSLSKLKEEQYALEFGKKNGINVIVFRIFNPIGKDMANKFLLTNLLQQINECKSGKSNQIKLSRLDAKRDYISVKDIAVAYRMVIEGKPKHHVYNVGSGSSIANGELLELIIQSSKLSPRPEIIETSESPEPLVAVQANIKRISDEFGWHPSDNVDNLIGEICSQ